MAPTNDNGPPGDKIFRRADAAAAQEALLPHLHTLLECALSWAADSAVLTNLDVVGALIQDCADVTRVLALLEGRTD